MTQRNDPHRPGAIVPANYEPILGYNCATSQDGWPVPSFGIVCELDRRTYDAKGHVLANGSCNGKSDRVCCTSEAYRRAGASGNEVYGSPGKCGSCGAWFIYGELWLHVPTGDYLHLGHDCASKYGLMMDRSAAELANGRHRAAIATQIRKAERAEDRAAFLESHQGLAAAFEVGDAQSANRGAQIIADIAARFVEFTSLSDKQVALVMKLADEIRNPKPPVPEDVHVPAPFGKGVEFEGVITSAKLRKSEFGVTWKISIKVAAPGGCWIAWGSAPAGVMEHARAITESQRGDRAELVRAALIGMHVDMKATLERPAPRDLATIETDRERADAERRNGEAHFAFMSRPSGYPVRYSHPERSPKRIATERAFEKAVHEERSAMLKTDAYLGKYIVPYDDVIASLAARGVTLDAMIATSLVKPARKKAKSAKVAA